LVDHQRVPQGYGRNRRNRPAGRAGLPGHRRQFLAGAQRPRSVHQPWGPDGAATGSNAASLSVNTAALTIGDHTVRVIVSGQCGSVTSSATLKVNAGITATGPTDATVCPGTDASFSAVASGTGPFTYQWSLDRADE